MSRHYKHPAVTAAALQSVRYTLLPPVLPASQLTITSRVTTCIFYNLVDKTKTSFFFIVLLFCRQTELHSLQPVTEHRPLALFYRFISKTKN